MQQPHATERIVRTHTVIYTVIWHYLANHGIAHVPAASTMHACRIVISAAGPDFKEKATLLALEGVHFMTPAKQYTDTVG